MANDDNKNIQFTGDPVAFDGAEGKRDPKVGKGRFDLIPTEVYYPLFKKAESNWFVDCHPAAIMLNIANEKFIDAIIQMTIYVYSDHIENDGIQASAFWPAVWPMLQDLAIHFQKGAEHYGERNCQRGIPLWSFKDSAMRHAAQTFEGKEDEPHKISVIWNLWMAQWTVMQEKEKESEQRLLAIERAAEARVNSVLGDDLKYAVTNLREVRKKLKSERFKYPSDSAKYEALSDSVEGLKYVINMLYSIAEKTDTPIITAVQSKLDTGVRKPTYQEITKAMGEPAEESKSATSADQNFDVNILSDREIPQEQRDKLKEFCRHMCDKLSKLNFEFGGGKDKWDKLIDEMAENAKEAGIPWPPKEPEVVPENKPTPKQESVKVVMSGEYDGKDRVTTFDGRKMLLSEWLFNCENHDRMLTYLKPGELLRELIIRVSNDQGLDQDYSNYAALFEKLHIEFKRYMMLHRDKKTVKVTMSADNIDEGAEFSKWPFTTQEVLDEAIARLKGISIQEDNVKKKLADNCKSEIQELHKLVGDIDKDAFDKAEARCNYSALSKTIPMDVLLREILQRLDLINCNTKHVKQAFVSRHQDTMTKITQRMDSIKRGSIGPVEAKQEDQIDSELVPIPDSWKQKREEKKAGMLKSIYMQKLRQLAEAYDRIKDLLTEINEAIDVDDFRKARAFVEEFNGYNQDFIKEWNQIADKADLRDQTKQ